MTIEQKNEKTNIKHSAFGCLNRFANPSKIPGEKGAWERAVKEKYEVENDEIFTFDDK